MKKLFFIGLTILNMFGCQNQQAQIQKQDINDLQELNLKGRVKCLREERRKGGIEEWIFNERGYLIEINI